MLQGPGQMRTWRRRSVRTVRTAGAALALTAVLAAGTIGNAGVVRAQDIATPEVSLTLGVPTVSVSGHGQVSVPPDTASVAIGIDVIQPTLAAAQAQATAQATAVIEALKGAGIAEEDIQTASFSVTILRDYDAAAVVEATPESENTDPTPMTGFEIVNQLQVTVRDPDKLGTCSTRRSMPGRTASTASPSMWMIRPPRRVRRESRRSRTPARKPRSWPQPRV